jgi:hypothetical protein
MGAHLEGHGTVWEGRQCFVQQLGTAEDMEASVRLGRGG